MKQVIKLEYILVAVKAISIFIVVMIGFRIMGNQAVGRLTAFDLVVVIALGALMGAPLADKDLNIYLAITGVATLVVLQRLTAYLTLKSKWFSKWAIGEPIKLIENGEVSVKGLRSSRLTYDNLIEELRLKGHTQVADVEMAYLEPEGHVSVISKKEKRPLTPSDLFPSKDKKK